MSKQLNRRDLVKLMALAPLMRYSVPQATPLLTQQYQRAATQSPNILVLVFDTLSARHVSLYGYDRATTPNLARFAEQAVVYHNHFATGNFTSPGTASMLTGTYPWTHRAFHLHGLVNEDLIEKNLFTAVGDEYYRVAYTHNLLVASLLDQFKMNLELFKPTRELCIRDLQFADRIFSNDYSVAFWSEWLYLRGGKNPAGSLFGSFADRGRRAIMKRQADGDHGDQYPVEIPNLHSLHFLLEDAVDWIGKEVAAFPTPYLAYFHLLPPHEPYRPRKDFVDIFKGDGFRPIEKPISNFSKGQGQNELNNQRRQYDEYLAFTDSELGRLLDKLEASGALDNTYVVLTSDHGELFERGIRGHVTQTLYDPVIRVPLLIRKPGQTRREDVYTNTSAVDLVPTLATAAGKAKPDWSEGRILPTFAGSSKAGRAIYAVEAKSNPKQAPLKNATFAMIQDDLKLVYYSGKKNLDSPYELYNLNNDLEELDDRYAADATVAASMTDELSAVLAKVNSPFLNA